MKKCEWSFVDDTEYHYKSECGGEWFFFEGNTIENEMDRCPFCGEPLYEANPTLQSN